MKGLFITFEALYEHSGISKKIIAQVEGFIQGGVNMKLSTLKLFKNRKYLFNGRVVDNNLIEIYSRNQIINKFQRIISFNKLFEYIIKNYINLIYIRYTHIANPFFINFLRKLKNRNVKILLEIPTYPYDQEYRNVSVGQSILLFIEKICRTKFKFYVDNIITFSEEKSIFNIQTINVSNGVDINNIKILPLIQSHDVIHLIGVASLAFWHGYDRIIEGMHKYYSFKNKLNIYFHIVGDDQSIEGIKYQNLVEKYNLHKYVIFHGMLSGCKLDEIYKQCNIAIGCLGVHRKGITHIKSIKNREYCARGIPFIYSEIDEDFEDKAFILKAPADDSPIDIMKIIEFLNRNQIDRNAIREYAEKYLTWKFQINKIIELAHLK